VGHRLPAAPSKASLMPSVTATAGACDAARPQYLMPSLAESAGACGQSTQLACNVLCLFWPRPLGLAVHKVSSPAMSKPLWRNRHTACCNKISSTPAVLCLLAVTFADLLLDCCFDCCAAVAHFLHDCNCQRSLPTILALSHDCSWLSFWTFVACSPCLVLLLAVTAVG
jgi:hypothetical protein